MPFCAPLSPSEIAYILGRSFVASGQAIGAPIGPFELNAWYKNALILWAGIPMARSS